MADYTFTAPSQTDLTVSFRNTTSFWGLYFGLEQGNPVTDFRHFKSLCNVMERDEISLTPINEEFIVSEGKRQLKVVEGYQVDSFILQVMGGDTTVGGSLIGQDLTTSPVLAIDGDKGEKGFFIWIGHDGRDTAKPRISFLLEKVNVEFLSASGSVDGTRANNAYSLYSVDAKLWKVSGSSVFATEIWFDDGVTINLTAPNGILDDFSPGDGNNSGANTPIPIAIRPNPSTGSTADWFDYYMDIRVEDSNGAMIRIADNAATVDAATGIITFATPPADGVRLLTIYVTGKDIAPHYANDALGVGNDWNTFNAPA